MRYRRNNCIVCFYQFKLSLSALGDVSMQLCGGLRVPNVATWCKMLLALKNFTIACEETECLNVEHIKHIKNSQNTPPS